MSNLAEHLELLRTGATSFGLELSDQDLHRFDRYIELLQEWNQKINLTTITAAEEVVVKHFLDSLTLCRFLPEKPARFIDIGTGAGLPGIPVKLLCPHIELTLLDATAKKVEFLKLLCQSLAVEVQAVTARAEEIGQQPGYRAKFGFATSRAVASIAVLAEYALPLLKIGGAFLAMKGRDVAAELKEAEYAIRLLGGSVEEVREIALPHSEIVRRIVVIRKIAPTPALYPRKPGTPQKKPLIL